MKTKRILLILLVVVVIAALAVAGVACNKSGGNTPSTPSDPSDPSGQGGQGQDPGPVLDTIAVPTGLAVDRAGKATWTRVTGASGYEVEINGTVVSARFTNSDLLVSATLPQDGRFTVKVRTVTDAGVSAWSDPITFTYQGSAVVTPQVSGLEGTTLKWTGSNVSFAGIAAPYPQLTIAGQTHALAAGTTSYDLGSLTAKSEVSLRYVADGVYLTDSAEVNFVYDPTSRSLAYAAPASAYMDGGVLRFAGVEGANVYYFKDVYNTVTSLSGSEVNSLSSDRAGHFLIKEVWAGNTDSNIADSDPVAVTYFTAEQGSGSASDPFLISNPSHLRFIEYYEALGQAKYYRLTQDIEFEPYTPQLDEDYSNFYNLGSLSGVLDGDGHTLSNIVVYYKDGYSSIFDSITTTGRIYNLKIASTAWRTWTNRTNDGIMHEKGGECAILAYTNNGIIQDVTLLSGSVTAVKDGAAGLVSINRGLIKGCVAEEDFEVYGANEAGAFAIYNAGTIERCINYGSVSGKSSVGGIVGRNAGLVNECSNHGAISGNINTGGIVGYNYNVQDVDGMQYDTMVSCCSNYGTVSCFAFVGGIVGRNGSDGYNEVGVNNFANAGVYGCYNRGAISGIISVGGIAGHNYAAYRGAQDAGFGIRACYNSGDVNSKVAGFASGRLYLSVAACSWAEVDAPDIYAHFWKGESEAYANWPGVKMSKTTVGDTDFYYVDMPAGFATNQITGVIFSRVDPNDSTAVFNKTSNVTAVATQDSAVYYIDGGWDGADLVQPCWGAITGYNNVINDCYYVSGSKIGGTDTMLKPSEGGTTSTAYALSRDEMRQVYTSLNEVLGFEAFVAVEGQYPILAWEQEQ